MLKQTIVWTALPHRIDGSPDPDATLRLSAFVAPRLWNDDGTPKMKLSESPDFLDWPSAVFGATFKVEFEGGPTLHGTVQTSAAPESDLWGALFEREHGRDPVRVPGSLRGRDPDLLGGRRPRGDRGHLPERRDELGLRRRVDPAQDGRPQ